MLPCVSSFSLFFSCLSLSCLIFLNNNNNNNNNSINLSHLIITLTSLLFPYSSSLFSCFVTRQSSGLVFLNRIFLLYFLFHNSWWLSFKYLVFLCTTWHTHTHTHTHTHIYIYIYIFFFTYLLTYSMEQSSSWEPNRFSDIYIYIYIYIYTHTHTHTHTYTYIHTYICMSINIHTCVYVCMVTRET